MNNEQPDDIEKSSCGKSRLKKILSQPGIEDAIAAVQDYALEKAVFKTIDEGAKEEFGDELKAILESDDKDSIDCFLEYEQVDLAISENYEDFLITFAVEAGPIIAKLWGLSESAGKLISLATYDKREWEAKVEDFYTRPVMLVSTKDVENHKEFIKRSREIEKQGFIVGASDHIPEGRVFLDVTEITNQRLRSVYKAIELCRKILKIKHEDLRAGAPKSLDIDQAFEIDQLVKSGKSNVSIAKQLGFKIYRDYYNKDVASRSFYKYKRLGKELDRKLEALEKYLISLQQPTNG